MPGKEGDAASLGTFAGLTSPADPAGLRHRHWHRTHPNIASAPHWRWGADGGGTPEPDVHGHVQLCAGDLGSRAGNSGPHTPCAPLPSSVSTLPEQGRPRWRCPFAPSSPSRPPRCCSPAARAPRPDSCRPEADGDPGGAQPPSAARATAWQARRPPSHRHPPGAPSSSSAVAALGGARRQRGGDRGKAERRTAHGPESEGAWVGLCAAAVSQRWYAGHLGCTAELRPLVVFAGVAQREAASLTGLAAGYLVSVLQI